VRFLAHDAHAPLPFLNATLDLAVSDLVLEHLKDLTGVFREARRVSRRNGRAVASDFVMASLRGDFRLDDVREIAPDDALAAR
jgi:ubiquinone/menaquinone biosynthesis C-methylase UbiE